LLLLSPDGADAGGLPMMMDRCVHRDVHNDPS
jgi:hypothetical protein